METDKTFHIKNKSSELELILEALDEKADLCHENGEVERIQQVNRLWNKLESHQTAPSAAPPPPPVLLREQQQIARLSVQHLGRNNHGMER
jgi:hypothetical protein